MTNARGLESLSNELLRDILDLMEADPDRSVSIDRRAYLSVESFRPPTSPPPLRAQDIGNFRLSCRRFAELAIPYQFTRVATRFSHAGFQRLEKISSRPHLAKHTKKFSYLIPHFYVEGRARIGELVRQANGELQALDPAYFEERAEAQRSIVRSGEDGRVLRRAMAAFRSLQHVQILRLQDEADRCLLDYVNDNREDATQLVDLRWSLACAHATGTVCQALRESKSQCNRFSGPMMNTSSLAVDRRLPSIVSSLAERLTCLELHFDMGLDLDERMRELGGLFKAAFAAAKNMQAVHIGFPARQPLRLGLEDIFHGIHWEKLRAFGVQSWRLDAQDIIDLAMRHRKTLRGLRLRDVQLKEGSMWKDVLAVLHDHMDQLEWVSLRRVDYSKHFDEMWAGSMEVPDDPPGGASDSDDEDFPSHVSIEDEATFDVHDDSELESDLDSTADSHTNTDDGPHANEFDISPDTPVSIPFCTCPRNSYPASADDLGDNGRSVVYQQRKLWEKWVVGRCPEHEI